jgi:hypothetical protein
MQSRTTWLPAITALAWLALGIEAKADLILSTPAGLSPGDTFRIVFATDASRDGTSTSIQTYNSFVTTDARNQAGGGNVTYDGTILTWTAIASTVSTSALTNIGTTGAPVYLSNGTLIAASDTTSAGGLWSGWIMNPIEFDLNNNFIGNHVIWTGTTPSGASAGANALGRSNPIGGTSGNTSGVWVNFSRIPASVIHLQLYGISQTLTVPEVAAVPEPSTLVLGTIGAACGLTFGLRRRRRQSAGR